MKNISSSACNCSNCINSLAQDIKGNILCRIKGITSYNYCCNGYKPRSLSLKPSSLLHVFLTCSKCAYYYPYSGKQEGLGICRYYQLRPFPGDKRKACSRFEEKTKNRRIGNL